MSHTRVCTWVSSLVSLGFLLLSGGDAFIMIDIEAHGFAFVSGDKDITVPTLTFPLGVVTNLFLSLESWLPRQVRFKNTSSWSFNTGFQ